MFILYQVTSGDEGIVHVERVAPGTVGTARFPISLVMTIGLLNKLPRDVELQVKCAKTGQIEIVVVHVVSDDRGG